MPNGMSRLPPFNLDMQEMSFNVTFAISIVFTEVRLNCAFPKVSKDTVISRFGIFKTEHLRRESRFVIYDSLVESIRTWWYPVLVPHDRRPLILGPQRARSNCHPWAISGEKSRLLGTPTRAYRLRREFAIHRRSFGRLRTAHSAGQTS